MDQIERFVISVLVANHSGVLSRVSGMFTRRGFNIDTLTVGETESPEFSRTDYSPEALVIEICGESSKINAFIELLEPYGIMEMCRTGLVALERGGSCLKDA